jgi:peptidoglycan LD-endopeptidase LytH
MTVYLRFLLGLFLSTHLLVVALIFCALVWTKVMGSRSIPPAQNSPPAAIQPPATTGTAVPLSPAQSPTPTAVASPSPSAATDQIRLIIPVAGVRASDLRDTYNDARSQGRVHNAIDIMAPRGTAVIAASDGEIIRLYSSDLGGNTVYQYNPDRKMVFYYAHLERYAEGIVAGHHAHQGEVIAYVGDTGNAGPGNYHLHFAIWFITDPTRYWDGVNINPYLILKDVH